MKAVAKTKAKSHVILLIIISIAFMLAGPETRAAVTDRAYPTMLSKGQAYVPPQHKTNTNDNSHLAKGQPYVPPQENSKNC